jgi:hypothetical protein
MAAARSSQRSLLRRAGVHDAIVEGTVDNQESRQAPLDAL